MGTREQVRPFVVAGTACLCIGFLFLLANESIGFAPSGSPAALVVWFVIIVATHLLLAGVDAEQIADMALSIRFLATLTLAGIAVLQLDLVSLGPVLGLPPQHFLAGAVLAVVIAWMLHSIRVDVRRLSAD